MRLLIPLCKHCLIPKDTCLHRLQLARPINKIKLKGTVTHQCLEYWGQIPNGTRCEVELKELNLQYYSNEDGSSDTEWQWVSRGWVPGEVRHFSRNKAGLFTIMLDQQVSLRLRVNPNSPWSDNEVKEVRSRLKRPKDIRLTKESNVSIW